MLTLEQFLKVQNMHAAIRGDRRVTVATEPNSGARLGPCCVCRESVYIAPMQEPPYTCSDCAKITPIKKLALCVGVPSDVRPAFTYEDMVALHNEVSALIRERDTLQECLNDYVARIAQGVMSTAPAPEAGR